MKPIVIFLQSRAWLYTAWNFVSRRRDYYSRQVLSFARNRRSFLSPASLQTRCVNGRIFGRPNTVSADFRDFVVFAKSSPTFEAVCIVLFATALCKANCATVTRKILAEVTDSRGILLLRLRERTSERLPDDWHGTKYRAVKQLSKNTHGGKNSPVRDRVTE